MIVHVVHVRAREDDVHAQLALGRLPTYAFPARRRRRRTPDQLGERQRAHEPDPPTIADPTAPTPNGATPTPTNDDTPVFKNSLTAGARRCPP